MKHHAGPFFGSVIFALTLGLVPCQALHAQAKGQAKPASTYSHKKADPDGTGVVYMGREIARIMGFTGADWLERDVRQKEEKTCMAIDRLPITPKSNVADIGAGTGYYTFRIAPRVPLGKVFAVDIQPEMLDYLEKKKLQLGLANVVVVKGKPDSPGLPESSIDVALLVDVYHELLYPAEMLAAIRKALKPGGKIVLLEYRAEDPRVPIKALHKMSVKQASLEMQAAGFVLRDEAEFLPWQHFLVYQKK